MIKKLLMLCCFGLLAFAVSARADSLFIGSQAGECCFNVNLSLNTTTNTMEVTASLTSGAQYFVDSGNNNHPGFAMNLLGGTSSNISISNLTSPWVMGDVHIADVTTNGPKLGTFDFFMNNPGPGSSKHNAGPLVFDIIGNGLTLSYDLFAKNNKGYYFAADIMDATGASGESGITADPTSPSPVPEPGSLFLLGTGLLTAAGFLRRRVAATIHW